MSDGPSLTYLFPNVLISRRRREKSTEFGVLVDTFTSIYRLSSIQIIHRVKKSNLLLEDPLLRWLAAATLRATLNKRLSSLDEADMWRDFLIRVDYIQSDLLERRREVSVKDASDIRFSRLQGVSDAGEAP